MIYGKLIDDKLVLAPHKLRIGKAVVYNPTEEMLIEAGYKPVQYTKPPKMESGYIAVSGWEETSEEIVQIWTAEFEPITEDEALTRYANELTGEQDETLTDATETLIEKYMEE